MKRIYIPLLFAVMSATSLAQQTYMGNGKAGFGGPVGLGSLDIAADSMNTLTFTLHKGSGDMNDALVIYLDNGTDGFTTTANFTDTTDGLRRAISGYNGGTQRAVFNFDSSFTPEYAVAFQPGKGTPGEAVFVRLSDTSEFGFISKPGFENSSTTTATDYSVTINDSLFRNSTNAVSFNFIGTYISNTGYRSDEAIGDSMTNFDQGWIPYTSTSSGFSFNATLPVTFGAFNGVFKGQSIQLSWSTKTELNTKLFEVQKSSNGTLWQTIGTINTKNSITGATYNYTDNNVPDNVTYYRLKLVDLDGKYSYSSVIIMRKNGVATIDLLGNPVKNVINLNITNSNTANYSLELFTIDGRKVTTQTYSHIGGTSKVSMNVPSNVKGTCLLRITSGNDKQTIKVIIE